MATPENTTGNLPNKVAGEYQRPLPRDFETASNGDVSWKDETGTYNWDALPVLPAGIFADLANAPISETDGTIYIGNGDTTSVHADWDGATQYEWLRYTADTSLWSGIAPTEGQKCFDTSSDTWYTYDGSSWAAENKVSSSNSATSTWYKYSLTYSDFSAAATFKSVALLTLTGKNQINKVRIKHSASFTGGSISAATMTVNDGAIYTSAFNVFQAAGNTVGLYNDINSNTTINDETGFTVYAEITTTGGNTNTLTAGAVDIYVEIITFIN